MTYAWNVILEFNAAGIIQGNAIENVVCETSAILAPVREKSNGVC